MAPHLRRLPISARHAFALAFDLAVRRDAVQSLLVPTVLHAPWLIASIRLPALTRLDEYTYAAVIPRAGLMLGWAFVFSLVGAMLRLRARTVFNTPPGAPPAPIWDCYWQGLKRVPWLYATEFVRTTLVSAGLGFGIAPGIWIGFRFASATESIVLREPNALRAFKHSFHLTGGRLERWLEMVVMSAMVFFSIPFVCLIGFLSTPRSGWTSWLGVCAIALIPVLSILQYAWTFFYLRLEEIDTPRGVVGSIPSMSGPGIGEHGDAGIVAEPVAGSGRPRLTLVEGGTSAEPSDD